ncbi:GerAB/ArcD/ProY family transporter [Paenibacillus sp. 598K]|uniref:GerAB/ArcD/ProY family transporter n=1 Tax=Paenibacillus sp. 598K TaxID=1117987 RepID=UPI000FFE3D68|nr:GerAB/ArcD/ProY family transporter [Paenibacillus sp. 598K]
MFIRTDNKITRSQAVVFLTNTVLGAGILTMPRSVSQAMHTPDSWLAILLSGLLILPIVWLMTRLSQYYPGLTVFQYAGRIVGKVPGTVMGLMLIVFFLTIAGFEIRILAEVTLFFLLEGTPIYAIILPFIWVGTYLVSGGIQAIARVHQVVFPITVLVLLVSFGVSLRLFDIDHLRPVLGNGLGPVWDGVKASILIFSGCEVVLIIVGFADKPKHAVRTMLAGISIPSVLYLLTIIVVVGGMSVNTVITSTWPTLDLVRSFEITGFFIERLEFPLMVIWLMQMFCNFCSFFFQASLGVSQLFRLPSQPVIFALVPVIFLAALAVNNQKELFALGDIIGYMSVGLFVLVTIPLLVIQIIRSRGRKPNG